jgi:WD40 repeat protein
MRSPAFSSDGTTLACGGDIRWVNVWDCSRDYRDIQFLYGNSGDVYCVAFFPNGRFLAICGYQPLIRIVNAFTTGDVQTLRSDGPGDEPRAVVPLTNETLVSAGTDSIRVWNVHDGKELAVVHPGWLTTHRRSASLWINCLVLSPDRQTLVSGGDAQEVRIWDVPKLLRARGEVKPEECEKWKDNFN